MSGRASALVLLAAVSAAGAQSTREVRLDAGAAQIQQTGRTAHDAAGIFGITWREGSPQFASLFSAAATYAGDSVSAAQALFAAAWRAHEQSARQTEAGISAASFGQTPLSRGGSFSGFARERLNVGAGGFWAGGAWGGTARDNTASHSTAVEIGTWRHAGEFDWLLSLSRTHSDDFSLLEAASIFTDPAATDLTDATLDMRYEHGALLFDVAGTWRNGAAATAANQSAIYFAATYTFSPRLAVVLASGRQLADPVRGVPDVNITSVVMRVSLVPLHSIGAPAEARASSYASLERKSAGALLTVRVPSDNDAVVEVAGSFSDWKPVPLTRTATGWEAQIALMAGRHRVAVRINGGVWKAPAGTARVRDEFGGEAGLIVVP